MQTDNPAGRLLHILKIGKTKSVHLSCKKVWAELLTVNENNLALLMSRLGKVMELPEQIIYQITIHYPNQKNTHEHWSGKVNTAFSTQNLNGMWNEFISHIDSHTIDYLSMAVDLLDMKEKTKILSDSELSDIHTRITELLQDIMNMSLDDDVKKYISRYLRKMLIAIEEYNISGSVPILESLENILGHAFVDEKYKNAIKETELGNKLITVLNIVASIVTVASGLPQLTVLSQLLLTGN